MTKTEISERSNVFSTAEWDWPTEWNIGYGSMTVLHSEKDLGVCHLLNWMTCDATFKGSWQPG